MKKPQLVFIEDKRDMAEGFFERLALNDRMESVFVANLTETKELLQKRGAKRLFWVDIHLGRGKTDEGIEAIKVIKRTEPNSTVIVYTGYPDKEADCIDAGADFFFEKDPITYEEDILEIRKLIIRHLQ